MSNINLGQYGEHLAEEFLKAKGYTILDKNFKNKIGEIDIIAKDQKTICFVEVKTRKSLTCGKPFESVHYFKQLKLIRVAQSYLKFKLGSVDILSRFDIISIYKDQTNKDQIEHIINAFELRGN